MIHDHVRHLLKAVAFVALITTEPLAMHVSQPPSLPPPTGPYAVGTTTWHVDDPSRREGFATEAKREVQVLARYPIASTDGRRAPYLRAGTIEAETFARLLRAPGRFDHIAALETHAILDAAPGGDAAKLPTLVFSHGY